MIQQFIYIFCLLLFIAACDDSTSIDYQSPKLDYHIKTSFSIGDGSSILTLADRVDSIRYKMTKLASDSTELPVVVNGVSLSHPLLFKDDLFKLGRYSGHFSLRDEHGIDLYALKLVSDTLIRKNDDRSVDWRVFVVRKKGVHHLISDSLIPENFIMASLTYSNTSMDSLLLDSVSLGENTFLTNVFTGEYHLKLSAQFQLNDTTVITKDSIFTSQLIRSDTTDLNITKLLFR
jgi:hypothetical protein